MIAETEFGRVRGAEQRGIKGFKGIPYATDTGDVNQFMSSVDPEPWAGVRDALEHGFSCPQTDPCPVVIADEEGPSTHKALVIPGEVPTAEGANLAIRGDVVASLQCGATAYDGHQ